ncbi:tetratricopeptide repeat protein [Planktothrix sp. FACHB-1355]|uniref:Tetratricopeptide repeat protein n=1 Tax=Aerosakkonema funiforme FACHB-1375 TaxID=2949571 RepID=A0A926VIM6_9CYAN|nr:MULTISPECIES: CHAT domain-containing tetratricopeptide repeat protein [Oscillatoriales]MBD2184547.1 tetratricopeptide repeat protein [Aerosakkonema funiforme FACHB-1375]MBD3559564.1 tetratricopeptide repeat protein [Planktothrix sp. FACHB-1355]
MQLQRIGLSVIVTLLFTILASHPVPLLMRFSTLQVLAQTTDGQKVEGERLLRQGLEQYQRGQLEAAMQSWEQALNIYRELKDKGAELAILAGLGSGYLQLRNYTKALEYQQQRLAIAQELKDPQLLGEALVNLGAIYQLLGNYNKAIEYYQPALAIAQELRNLPWLSTTIAGLSIAYSSLGDYEKAIEYLQKDLEIKRSLNDRKGEESTLGALGAAYHSLGNYYKAIEYFQESLEITRELNDRQAELSSLTDIGTAYENLGDYSKAIEYHQQSLIIAQELKNREAEGYVLANIGLVYHDLGDYGKAIEFQQQSLTIAQETKDREAEAVAVSRLGLIYAAIGDYSKAIEWHQQHLVIERERHDLEGQITALGNLGIAYKNLKDYPKAIDYYQQSLTIAQQVKNPQNKQGILGNLGVVYFEQGDYTRAIQLYQESLSIAREIKDRQSEGDILGNLGAAYNGLRDYAKAIDYHQQFLKITQEIGDRQGEAIALNNLGVSLFRSGNLAEAEKNLRLGIKVLDSIRSGLGNRDSEKVSIFEIQGRTYRALQEVLIAQNKIHEALEIAEGGRARAFIDLLTSRLSSQSPINSPITYPSLVEIQQISKTQKATIVVYSIISDSRKESNLFIWVIKPTGDVTFRQFDLKELEREKRTIANLVPRVRQAIGVRSGANTNEAAFKPGDRIHFKGENRNSEPWEVVSFDPQNGILMVRHPSFATTSVIPKSINDVEDFGQTSLQQLHQILIEPIADLLPKNPSDRVIFIPQGELFLVPFPALQDKDGKYLIEKHTILTAPSIQVLDLTRKQRQRLANSTAKDVLVVGNPSPMPAPFQPLEYAEPEAKAIANLLNTNAITGTQATESAIVAQMSNAKMIHLATHGQFDDIRGLGSAIALAPSGKDDGLLTAEEILNLKLNAELVVLSACDTGRGRLTGDGVIGLSRSLISAGVPSVIVSLWKVPDNTTSGLMVEFYRQLKGNPDKAQALRQAMLITMQQHPNPRDWAAFTLIGEAE